MRLFFHSKAFQPGSSLPLQVPLERSSSQLAEALRQLDASQAGSRVTDLFLLKAQLWWRASYCKLIHHLKQHYSSSCPNLRSCLLDERTNMAECWVAGKPFIWWHAEQSKGHSKVSSHRNMPVYIYIYIYIFKFFYGQGLGKLVVKGWLGNGQHWRPPIDLCNWKNDFAIRRTP